MQSFNTHGHEETIDSNGASEDSRTFNESYVTEFFKSKKMRQRLQMEADSALLCLIFISCLMLFGIWYLRGFHSRNTHNREVTFHDSGHLLSVKEVLYRKRHFLPMFIRDDGIEEVWVHDCGNDP
ncbi:hypothetical protein PoB_005308400 [Plakobranchus ocellatus]|uniref:Uncharacterized protein n=1 Tax=Plakobranchus ocellatus TaxID=259542 RepID=A0AAV4C7C0_9GAST|nr:hypothetical protein PoB_005308400 [Plakobranchus ocellatus]